MAEPTYSRALFARSERFTLSSGRAIQLLPLGCAAKYKVLRRGDIAADGFGICPISLVPALLQLLRATPVA